MGLKRITAVVEVTYPADDERTWEQMSHATVTAFVTGLVEADEGGRLPSFRVINTSVDPDAEPSLPEPEPTDQSGLTKP